MGRVGLQYDPLTRNLIRRSMAVIGLLASLTLGSLTIFWLQTRAIESAASVLNVSGRQRMLSQRTALLAECLLWQDPGRPEVEPMARSHCHRRLVELIEQMERAHRGLVAGDGGLDLPSTAPPEVLRIYHSPPDMLDERMQSYLGALRSLTNSRRPTRQDPSFREVQRVAYEGHLLQSLDAVVNAFQDREERMVAHLQRIKLFVVALTLITIVVMHRRVVRPMGARVARHLNDLGVREESLRRQGEQLRLTLENAPVGIATCNLEGVMLRVNQALCRMLGQPDDALLGHRYLEFVHPQSVGDHETLLQDIRDHDLRVFSRPQRFLGGDQQILRGNLRGAVVESSSGDPGMIILQFEDHSERLRAEEALHSLQERLADMNRLGTMGEMAAGIAHEINQPLSAIVTYARACRRSLASDPAAASRQVPATLDKISDQALRASEVIRRIRSLVERRDIERRASDLIATLDEAVALAEMEARASGLAIETDFRQVPEVSIDRVQIQQVLLNLIRNGLESVTAAGRRDALIVGCGPRDDGSVEVWVKDRGSGISPGDETTIFEPFFTTKREGMGMGLSICRSIVEAHGGRLWFTSNDGIGSIFRFSLP